MMHKDHGCICFCVCFCVCGRQKPEDPQFEPHGWRCYYKGQYKRSGISLVYLWALWDFIKNFNTEIFWRGFHWIILLLYGFSLNLLFINRQLFLFFMYLLLWFVSCFHVLHLTSASLVPYHDGLYTWQSFQYYLYYRSVLNFKMQLKVPLW